MRKLTVYIDRARGRRLGAKLNRYARTQKSSNSLIRFHCSNSCFLLETGIAGHERPLYYIITRQMTPQIREETAKTAVFRQRWQAWKVVRSIAAVRQRRRTPRNWRCSFAFFESLLWYFNKKQHAEVILRLSRPVLCKNQENGPGKQWSLPALRNDLIKGQNCIFWRKWLIDLFIKYILKRINWGNCVKKVCPKAGLFLCFILETLQAEASLQGIQVNHELLPKWMYRRKRAEIARKLIPQ